MRSKAPLNALRAFEATVRLGSMTAAARELDVTHGAISRHIRLLEDQFGLPLLTRQPKATAATEAGIQLASDIKKGLDLIDTAVSRLQPGPLTISCSATIMMHWLMPRLDGFRKSHPDIEMRLNINFGHVDFIRDQISIAIRNSMFSSQDGIVTPLMGERIGPVCHPSMADKIMSPDSLRACKLLGTATRVNGWKEWVNMLDRDDLVLTPCETYDHFYLTIQAAICSLGVALAPKFLVEDELESRKLVAPLGFIYGPHTLNLWTAPHLRRQSEIRQVCAWIQEEMLKSE